MKPISSPIRPVLLLAACSLLLQGLLDTASAASKGNQNPLQAGRTNFNAADRFAFTNVILAMTSGLDEKNVDLMLANLAPEFSAEYRLVGMDPIKVVGREAFGKMMAKRFENLNGLGVERRHIISPLYVLEQSPDSAKVVIHVLTCTATKKMEWRPMSSAKVEFLLRKQDGIWLCCRQLETLDCALDLPISLVVPGIH